MALPEKHFPQYVGFISFSLPDKKSKTRLISVTTDTSISLKYKLTKIPSFLVFIPRVLALWSCLQLIITCTTSIEHPDKNASLLRHSVLMLSLYIHKDINVLENWKKKNPKKSSSEWSYFQNLSIMTCLFHFDSQRSRRRYHDSSSKERFRFTLTFYEYVCFISI